MIISIHGLVNSRRIPVLPSEPVSSTEYTSASALSSDTMMLEWQHPDASVQSVVSPSATALNGAEIKLVWTKPRALAVYIDGQSNATGRAAMNTLLDDRYNAEMTGAKTKGGTVWIWHGGSWKVLYAGINQTGTATIGNDTEDLGAHGVELALGYQLAKQTLQDVYIIKSGQGGTTLAEDAANDHNINSVNELHQRFLNVVDAAEAAIPCSFDRWGWAWIQGESDAQNATYAAAYETNLTAKVDAVRTRLGATIPVGIMRIQPDIPGTTADKTAVRDAQAAVVAAKAPATLIDTDGLARFDTYHFTSDSYHEIGKRLFYQVNDL